MTIQGSINGTNGQQSCRPMDVHLAFMITVEFFMKGKPGVQRVKFTSRWEAEQFYQAKLDDLNCDAVHILGPRQ